MYSGYFQENEMVGKENVDRSKVEDEIRPGHNCRKIWTLQWRYGGFFMLVMEITNASEQWSNMKTVLSR